MREIAISSRSPRRATRAATSASASLEVAVAAYPGLLRATYIDRHRRSVAQTHPSTSPSSIPRNNGSYLELPARRMIEPFIEPTVMLAAGKTLASWVAPALGGCVDCWRDDRA